MTAFIGRLAAMSLSGSALIILLLAFAPLLRKRPALHYAFCIAAALRLLLPAAPMGQRFLRQCLAALPTPEGGFYLTAYRLAEFGAAQVIAFLWFFGLCAVLIPPLWAHIRNGSRPSAGKLLLMLVTGVHWFNPLVWRLNRAAEQARPDTDPPRGTAPLQKKGRPSC